ncbi:MAG: EamA family transporter [Chloroflexota bacterium]|jgi:drug/metabolite transporter (DMT)-like permease|nr:MAG: EamA family transporter [Chloroflexota bacterium]
MNSSAKGNSPSGLAIWSAMIALYIVWGSTYLAIRFVVETMPPFLAAGFRFLIAGAVLYAFTRLRGDKAPIRIEWRSAAIIGLFLIVGGNGAVMWAEQRVASGIASLMIASVPLWIALLDTIRPGGRRPNRWVVVSVIAGFIGIIILIGPSQMVGSQDQVDLLGIAVLTFAAFSWAIGSLYNRGARLPDSPLLATGMQMLAGSLGLFILGTVVGEWNLVDPAGFSTRSLIGFGYLVIFGSWVGFASYIWLLRVAPITLVSTYAYVNPLVAILLGSLLAGETLTPRVLLAALFILGSVVVITMRQPVRSKAATIEETQLAGGND